MPKSSGGNLRYARRPRVAPVNARGAAAPVYLPDDLGTGVPLGGLAESAELSLLTPLSLGGNFDEIAALPDARVWNPPLSRAPLDYGPAYTVSGSRAVLRPSQRAPARRAKRASGAFSPPAVIAFHKPNRVLICVRRRRRREALFAAGVPGHRRVKRGKRNAYSSISCRG